MSSIEAVNLLWFFFFFFLFQEAGCSPDTGRQDIDG